METKKTEIKSTSPLQTGLKIVIIIVIILVLLLISFAMIKLVPAVFSSISRFRDTLSFFGNKEKIALVLDKRTISDQGNVVLSWKQQRGNAEGEHSLSYPCEALDNDTHLELTEANGNLRSVFCEEDIFLGNAGESDYHKLTLKGFSDADEDQILHLTVSHVGATSTYASSTIPLTIKRTTTRVTPQNTQNASSTSKDTTKTSTTTVKIESPTHVVEKSYQEQTVVTPTYTNTRTYNTYRTPADLGMVFTQAGIRSNDDGIVEFQVINYGQSPSGQWRFRAVFPQNGDSVTYNSPYQSSIPGGKASIMTLRFENADRGTVEVIIDYYNEVPESNNNNNRATVKIN